MFDGSTVFIVDDDEQARESVCALIQSMGLAVRQFSAGEELLDHITPHDRGCVITDLRMVGMSGLELQDALREHGIAIPVILITAFPRTPLTVRAIKHGAVTLLEKPYEDDDLWDAVREALQMDSTQRASQIRQHEIQQRLDTLTEKEIQVMNLMIEGTANKVIARRLDVSIRTVENRRHDVFAKMNAGSLAELVRMVMEVRDPDSESDG